MSHEVKHIQESRATFEKKLEQLQGMLRSRMAQRDSTPPDTFADVRCAPLDLMKFDEELSALQAKYAHAPTRGAASPPPQHDTITEVAKSSGHYVNMSKSSLFGKGSSLPPQSDVTLDDFEQGPRKHASSPPATHGQARSSLHRSSQLFMMNGGSGNSTQRALLTSPIDQSPFEPTPPHLASTHGPGLSTQNGWMSTRQEEEPSSWKHPPRNTRGHDRKPLRGGFIAEDETVRRSASHSHTTSQDPISDPAAPSQYGSVSHRSGVSASDSHGNHRLTPMGLQDLIRKVHTKSHRPPDETARCPSDSNKSKRPNNTNSSPKSSGSRFEHGGRNQRNTKSHFDAFHGPISSVSIETKDLSERDNAYRQNQEHVVSMRPMDRDGYAVRRIPCEELNQPCPDAFSDSQPHLYVEEDPSNLAGPSDEYSSHASVTTHAIQHRLDADARATSYSSSPSSRHQGIRPGYATTISRNKASARGTRSSPVTHSRGGRENASAQPSSTCRNTTNRVTQVRRDLTQVIPRPLGLIEVERTNWQRSLRSSSSPQPVNHRTTRNTRLVRPRASSSKVDASRKETPAGSLPSTTPRVPNTRFRTQSALVPASPTPLLSSTTTFPSNPVQTGRRRNSFPMRPTEGPRSITAAHSPEECLANNYSDGGHSTPTAARLTSSPHHFRTSNIHREEEVSSPIFGHPSPRGQPHIESGYMHPVEKESQRRSVGNSAVVPYYQNPNSLIHNTALGSHDLLLRSRVEAAPNSETLDCRGAPNRGVIMNRHMISGDRSKEREASPVAGMRPPVEVVRQPLGVTVSSPLASYLQQFYPSHGIANHNHYENSMGYAPVYLPPPPPPHHSHQMLLHPTPSTQPPFIGSFPHLGFHATPDAMCNNAARVLERATLPHFASTRLGHAFHHGSPGAPVSPTVGTHDAPLYSFSQSGTLNAPSSYRMEQHPAPTQSFLTPRAHESLNTSDIYPAPYRSIQVPVSPVKMGGGVFHQTRRINTNNVHFSSGSYAKSWADPNHGTESSEVLLPSAANTTTQISSTGRLIGAGENNRDDWTKKLVDRIRVLRQLMPSTT